MANRRIKRIVKEILLRNEWLHPILSKFGLEFHTYQYAGLFDYCAKERGIKYTIKEDNTHDVRSAFCKAIGLNALGKYEKGRDYKVYISIINNANVFADSEFIYKDNRILTDRFCYDMYNRYLCPPLVYARKGRALYLNRGKHERIEKGIFLLKYWGTGWWHLTVEVLPRILLIDLYEEFKDYPLLIDEEIFLDQRSIDLLNIINKTNHPIIKLKRNVEYYVEEIVYPSHVSWLLWNQKQANSGQSWAVETSLVRAVRDIVLKSVEIEKKYGDKIFITRGNNNRFDNEMETAEYFSENGFQVLCPENLTFKEEVEMCFYAKAIVCTLGSAMTNILYANENVKHVMIGLKECQTEANAPIIDAVGISNYRYYCAETVIRGDYIKNSLGHIPRSGMDEIIKFCSED